MKSLPEVLTIYDELTEPSRALDFDIAIATNFYRVFSSEVSGKVSIYTVDGDEPSLIATGDIGMKFEPGNSCPFFTASLDAILDLRERLIPDWYLVNASDQRTSEGGSGPKTVGQEVHYSNATLSVVTAAATPALAHGKAVLKALQLSRGLNAAMIMTTIENEAVRMLSSVSKDVLLDASRLFMGFNGKAVVPTIAFLADGASVSLSWNDPEADNLLSITFDGTGSARGYRTEGRAEPKSWICDTNSPLQALWYMNLRPVAKLISRHANG